MKKYAVALIVILFIVVSGCNNNAVSNASPKEVLVAFFDKLVKKDFDGAAALATSDSKPIIEMIKMQMAMREDNPDAKKMDMSEEFKNIQIGEAVINGDAATVPIKINKGDGINLDFPVKKENGSWKVDFTQNSLMNMGMKEHNHMMHNEKMDSAIRHLDPAKLEEARDSIMKHMDPEKLKEFKKAVEAMKQQQQQQH
ncbi:MAG: hypothetical protein ABI480_18605 [Chitinophagaceae bacterium]